MEITIIYTGKLFKVTGRSIEQVELKGDFDIRKLIDFLEKRYGESFKSNLIDKAKGNIKIPIFVNGKKQGYDYIISDMDRVAFMFVVSGG